MKKKFVFKFLLFLSPIIIFVVYNFYATIILPIDYFAFRCWEALEVIENNQILTGPFYPDQFLQKKEEGDLAHYSSVASLKDVTWETDQYGFRNENRGLTQYDVVIVGDSFTVGTSLTQSDTVAEKLHAESGMTVYPYAPYNLNKFIRELRFQQHPPKVVVFESVQKLILGTQALNVPAALKQQWPESIRTNKTLVQAAILRDRLQKQSFAYRLYSKASDFPEQILSKIELDLKILSNGSKKTMVQADPIKTETREPYKTEFKDLNVSLDQSMVFSSEASEHFIEASDSDIKTFTENMVAYHDYFKSKGITFIFMGIPNKENVYYNRTSGGVEVKWLSKLNKSLEDNGVIVADLESVFKQAVEDNPERLVYQRDDSHWNAYGAELAAQLLSKVIKSNSL